MEEESCWITRALDVLTIYPVNKHKVLNSIICLVCVYIKPGEQFRKKGLFLQTKGIYKNKSRGGGGQNVREAQNYSDQINEENSDQMNEENPDQMNEENPDTMNEENSDQMNEENPDQMKEENPD